MRFAQDYLYRYLCECPVPLALERCFECEILSGMEFSPPVLDLGCGEGLLAKTLFAEKLDVGLDPNPRELDRARHNGAYRKLICAPGDRIEAAPESFGTILSNSVLEHVADLEPVLREAHRVLRADGRFYATVPSQFFDRYTGMQFSMCLLPELANQSDAAYSK